MQITTMLRLGGSLLALGCASAIPTLAMAQDAALSTWTTRGAMEDDAWNAAKAELQALGEQHETSWDLYQALVDANLTDGDDGLLTWDEIAGSPEVYDWSGVFTRTRGGLQFDPDIGRGDALTAQLTPEGQTVLDAKIEFMERTGGEYDPISDCRPPGFPRWYTEPFLHDFAVTPTVTYLNNEMVNDIRRVYTDGRDHTLEADAYATWNGDTIGVWTDDGVLITHTRYLRSGQYQRGIQPDYSDQVTVTERMRMTEVDGRRQIQVDSWVYDPVNLAEPWYTRQGWIELTNDDTLLRIRYWDCSENPNNDIVITQEGVSQFPDFDFVPNDAEISRDQAVQDPNARLPIPSRSDALVRPGLGLGPAPAPDGGGLPPGLGPQPSPAPAQ